MNENIIFITRSIVRKRAHNGKQKLIDEINWLVSLPEEVKNRFPEVLESSVNEANVYYEMPFYNIPTLRQAIFYGKINGNIACDILNKIFDFMYVNFYSKINKDVPSDFIKKTHFDRVLERIDLVKKQTKIFDKIISKKYVLMDGKKYQNALSIIENFKSENKLIKMLSPCWTSKIHGDLHFDNILIDIDQDNVLTNFVLIDPRGYSQDSDYGYDLGKLWHSFHGLYDFVNNGCSNIDYKEISKTEIEVCIQFSNRNILREYEFILDKFPKLLDEKYKLNAIDKYWEFRTLFTEAMHFLSLPDFHLRFDEREEKAISLYMIGVKLLNKVWENYVRNYK